MNWRPAAFFNGQLRELPNDFDAFFEPETSAVVEIDMHRGHLGGPDSTCPVNHGIPLIPRYNAFNQRARELGVTLVHARLIWRRDCTDHLGGPTGEWPTLTIERFLFGDAARLEEHNLEGSQWTEFMVDIAEEDYVINYKKRLSAFFATDLEFLLRRLSIRNVIITGVMTDACVTSTAFDAVNRDFRVLVPQDLVFGTPEAHDAALQVMSMHVGLVVNSEDLLEAWTRRRASVSSS